MLHVDHGWLRQITGNQITDHCSVDRLDVHSWYAKESEIAEFWINRQNNIKMFCY